MRFIGAVVLAFVTLGTVFAGDDASGSVPFRVDLSQHFTAYSMTTQDELWSATLAARFAYKGRAVHFVRTSIPLNMGDKIIQGAVYQSLEKPDVFYVVNSDAMLKLGTNGPTTQVSGAFQCTRRNHEISLFALISSKAECLSFRVRRFARESSRGRGMTTGTGSSKLRSTSQAWKAGGSTHRYAATQRSVSSHCSSVI